jgi:hypothetical protein
MVVVMESSMGDADLPGLLAQIAVFKRRFGLVLSGVAPGLAALGAQGLQSLRNFAVFDHLYFSGDPAWLVADGLTNRQIGAEMYLAEKTVKNYVSSLLHAGRERRKTRRKDIRIGRRGGGDSMVHTSVTMSDRDG